MSFITSCRHDVLALFLAQIQEDFEFDQLGNTHIIVDVYYANSSTPVSSSYTSYVHAVPCDCYMYVPLQATMNHNWHVHSFASPDSDTTCSPTVGPHYNPYSISLGKFVVLQRGGGGLRVQFDSPINHMNAENYCCYSPQSMNCTPVPPS